MSDVPPLWPAQQEAVEFALSRPATMLDMDMGTGKTRVAIECMKARPDVSKVLIVCPKAVIPVWVDQIGRFGGGHRKWKVMGKRSNETVRAFADRAGEALSHGHDSVEFIQAFVVNYDSVWRRPLGDLLCHVAERDMLQMVVLDESHRAKAAGSKVSKYLAMLGRRVRYRLCLSGTPMANSPLDVYGQYRFLDRSIFGTNHERFLQQYAIMGGPDRNFVVGYKNQQELMEGFRSIAYSCRMDDVRDRLKLPEALPDQVVPVELPARSMKALRELQRDFVAECGRGFAVASNVLVRLLRMQQVCSGFCEVVPAPGEEPVVEEMNRAKEDALHDLLQDVPVGEHVVVFGVFRHDLHSIRSAAGTAGHDCFELSGAANQLEEWRERGGVLAVQVQAGAEGVDMTCAHRAFYLTLPHSLALYEQSRARLCRPGQAERVSFCHLIATGTVDEGVYGSLRAKRDVIDSIRAGSFDFGYMRR